MNFLCIAASNSRKPVQESVSYKVCMLAKGLIEHYRSDSQSSVICLSLKDFNMNPCTLCGACAESCLCPQDPEFNRLLKVMNEADGYVFVVPHYSPLQCKPFVVIGHGGMTETPEVLKAYHKTLVMPVARTLKSFGMVEALDHQQYWQSTVFGLLSDDCLQTSTGNIFPDIILDESRIVTRIETAIKQLIQLKED